MNNKNVHLGACKLHIGSISSHTEDLSELEVHLETIYALSSYYGEVRFPRISYRQIFYDSFIDALVKDDDGFLAASRPISAPAMGDIGVGLGLSALAAHVGGFDPVWDVATLPDTPIAKTPDLLIYPGEEGGSYVVESKATTHFENLRAMFDRAWLQLRGPYARCASKLYSTVSYIRIADKSGPKTVVNIDCSEYSRSRKCAVDLARAQLINLSDWINPSDSLMLVRQYVWSLKGVRKPDVTLKMSGYSMSLNFLNVYAGPSDLKCNVKVDFYKDGFAIVKMAPDVQYYLAEALEESPGSEPKIIVSARDSICEAAKPVQELYAEYGSIFNCEAIKLTVGKESIGAFFKNRPHGFALSNGVLKMYIPCREALSLDDWAWTASVIRENLPDTQAISFKDFLRFLKNLLGSIC